MTQVLSPIEEEDNEDNIHQERDPLVEALFPSRSEADFPGSKQSMELNVNEHVFTWSLHFLNTVDLLYVCYAISASKSGSNPEEVILTSH